MSAMRQVYSPAVWAYYRNPCHVGTLDANAANVGTGQVGTPAEGAVLRIQIQVDGTGRIRAARFKAWGCGATIACGALAAQRLHGCTLEQALALDSQTFVHALTLAPVKLYCAVLAEDAIQAAVHDYRSKGTTA